MILDLFYNVNIIVKYFNDGINCNKSIFFSFLLGNLTLKSGICWVFQEDNDPKHTVNKINRTFSGCCVLTNNKTNTHTHSRGYYVTLLKRSLPSDWTLQWANPTRFPTCNSLWEFLNIFYTTISSLTSKLVCRCLRDLHFPSCKQLMLDFILSSTNSNQRITSDTCSRV